MYVGRLVGALGFQRLVAIKRPHRHLLDDPRLLQMLLDEALLASKLQHPNVVSVQDVVQVDGVVYLVMDLVDGASLSELVRASIERSIPFPPGVAVRLLLDTCAGLHAAHELCDESGEHLGLVHRDVSPHNVLVSIDGVARVTDFGIAKCMNVHGVSTTTGTLKGKYAYMAPEHIQGRKLDRRADVFSLGVVAWEVLAGRRLFLGESPPNTMMKIVHEEAPPLSSSTDVFGTSLDDVLAQALTKEPSDRFLTVEAFAAALEGSARAATGVASAKDVSKLVRLLAGEALDRRKQKIKALLEELSAPEADADRPTEPLPEHMAALDTAVSISGHDVSLRGQELSPQAMDVEISAVSAEPSRPALVPSSARSAGTEGAPMSVIASSAPAVRSARRGWTLMLVVGALALGGAATLVVQQLTGRSDASGPVESASRDTASIPASVGQPAVTEAESVEPPEEAGAASAVSVAAPTPKPPDRDERRDRGTEGGATSKRVDAGTKVEPPAASGTSTTRSPPPNPYATRKDAGR